MGKRKSKSTCVLKIGCFAVWSPRVNLVYILQRFLDELIIEYVHECQTSFKMQTNQRKLWTCNKPVISFNSAPCLLSLIYIFNFQMFLQHPNTTTTLSLNAFFFHQQSQMFHPKLPNTKLISVNFIYC